jgi:diphosphomevalonate decarboxylase
MNPIQVSAPSNIALIKYMGKVSAQNTPTNASLSWTLEGLRSFVELQVCDEPNDQWSALSGFEELKMSAQGQAKFLKHVERCRQFLGGKEKFSIKSANNFPSDAGIASSASSFAALTKAVFSFYSREADVKSMSELSRQGSGSSCRSFFSPWSLWQGTQATAIDLKLPKLLHQVIVVDSGLKSVSSSEAHTRVLSSALFLGRPERADQRLKILIESLSSGDWQKSFDLVWAEFWDMHALFETSQPAFGYLRPETLSVLAKVRELWQTHKDGPLATLDAGPNIHLLWRPDQAQFCKTHLPSLAGAGKIFATDLENKMQVMA